MTRANATEQRIPRLLSLVPYLQARPGIAVADAAADFGVTEEQLRRDLTLLWMCGLPGHGPGDLIDLSFEGENVDVVFDAGMSRPLRLTTEEALAVVVALRVLAETPGLADTGAVRRALAKVESAAGGAVPGETVEVALDAAVRVRPVFARALADGHALRIRYYSATRDETTDRVVDPVRLFDVDGVDYLEAWCRSAEGMRVFRLDRVDRVDELDEPAAVPADAPRRDAADGVFRPAVDHLLVELRLSPAYAWVADYYSVEDVADSPDGLRVRLRVFDPAWVRTMALGAAGHVQVLSPEWLAEQVRSEAERALAAYPGG